jgi:hypothetical protein
VSARSRVTPPTVSEDVYSLRAATTEVVRALTGRYTASSLHTAALAMQRAEASLRQLRIHTHRLVRDLRADETP